MSEGFLLRTAYEKRVDPAKLDELLEHRVKQQAIEERQKKSAISANPKVVIQRLKFKMEPHGAVACIQPEVKSEVKKGAQESTKEPVLSLVHSVSQEARTNGSTGECVGRGEPGGGGTTPGLSHSQSGIQKTTPLFLRDSHKLCVNLDNVKLSESGTVLPSTGGSSEQKSLGTGNQQTSESTPTQVNKVSLGENGDGYREQESKGNGSRFLQMNGQDVKEPGTEETLTNSVVNNRRIEDDKKALSLKDPLKPVVNGSSGLVGDLGTDAAGGNPEYLPPQKVPRLGVTVEDLALSSPTIPKSEPTLDSKEHSRMEARLDGDDKVSQRTIVPSPVLSAEESSLSNDFVESNCSRGSHTTVVTQVTATITTTTESQTISSGTATQSNTVSTLTTKTTVTQETKTTTAPSTENSSWIVSKAITRVQSTRERVQLIRFSRTKKARSETALPTYRKFATKSCKKSCKKSIFILPNEELKKLARKGGFREVSVFSYSAKPAPDIWPYPSPRPTFGITWR